MHLPTLQAHAVNCGARGVPRGIVKGRARGEGVERRSCTAADADDCGSMHGSHLTGSPHKLSFRSHGGEASKKKKERKKLDGCK